MSKTVYVVMSAGEWAPSMVFEHFEDAVETFEHRDDVSIVPMSINTEPYDWEAE